MKIKDLPQEIIDLIYDFVGKIDSLGAYNKFIENIKKKEVLLPPNFTIHNDTKFTKNEHYIYKMLTKKYIWVDSNYFKSIMSKEEYIKLKNNF
jgi:replication-associated recombination protein RarA